jgi:hypothetical protein
VSVALKKIRAEICKRSEGACEACGVWVGLNGELAHADHAYGRGKGRPPESIENVWLLCIPCDERRTLNKPDAAYWQVAFIEHCGKYGYSTERAEARLEALKAKGFAGATR